MDNMVSPFTIGHHDPKRSLPVNSELVAQAQAANYDIVTSSITTSHFHSRVLALLSTFLSESLDSGSDNLTSSYNASPVVVAPLTPADTALTPSESINQTVALTSSWIDLGSPDPVIADISKQVLRLELTYAAFCGISYVIIPGPRLRGRGAGHRSISQFARTILEALSHGSYMQISIWLPMIDHFENETAQMGDLAPFVRSQFEEEHDHSDNRMELFGSWQAWDTIRSMCKYSTRICIALSVPRLLPPTSIQSRWFSEPVRQLSLDSSVFTKNPKGYPVLTKAHQALVSRFAHFKQPSVWFLLCNVGPIPGNPSNNNHHADPASFPTPAEGSASPQLKDPSPHLSYMRNLQTKLPIQSATDQFAAGYQDYLQAPLQPLTVNLESVTYEVFEKDPIKYEWYERAVARALHDWVEQGKPTSNPDGRVVVAVVGAGRGPLVTRALQASEDVGVEIDMWALEKNPNAFVLLQRHNETKWNGRVNLVKSDMRTWRGPVRRANATQVRKIYNLDPDEVETEEDIQVLQPPEPNISNFTGSVETDQNYLLATANHQTSNYKIDIVISELLGSFGDNELSPECLDGIQHLLNPVHGISIPTSYTAFITPVAAPKLHADISLTMSNTAPNAAETPHVVLLNAIDFLSTETATPNSQSLVQSSSASSRQSYSAAAKHTSTDSTTPVPTSLSPDPIIHSAWKFHHPNPRLPSIAAGSILSTTAPSNAHNARHCALSFHIRNRSTCHGLAGYFESVLYPSVELSTNPLTMDQKSEGMTSWFAMFFPLKRPLYMPDNSKVTLQMWRQTDDRKVWYEWIVDVYGLITETVVDGTTGAKKERTKEVKIGGSELHSSEKEAFLM